jgi:hypothetical protein
VACPAVALRVPAQQLTNNPPLLTCTPEQNFRRNYPEKSSANSAQRNNLYLSQKLTQIDDLAKREELLQAMAHGSAAAWGHLNLLGEYDFSADKLQDSVGIKPPKLTD